MRITLSRTIGIVFLVIGLTSCSQGASSKNAAPDTESRDLSKREESEKGVTGMDESGTARDKRGVSRTDPQSPRTDGSPVQDSADMAKERLKVKKGSLDVRVKDLGETEKGVADRVEKMGGYVASTAFNRASGTMVLKIPEARFDEFITATEGMGYLISKNISTEDVTAAFYDLENRIKNKRALLDRMRAYLGTARTIQEMLDVEKQLSNLTTEIEGLERSFRGLSNQISFSTLTLTVRLPEDLVPSDAGASLADGFRNLGQNIAGFFSGFLFVVIYLVIFGIPTLAVFAGLWFLLFGKLGLFRRLWRALNGTKKAA